MSDNYNRVKFKELTQRLFETVEEMYLCVKDSTWTALPVQYVSNISFQKETANLLLRLTIQN